MRRCETCGHAEYHGLPPEGAPEWYRCTIWMWCAKHESTTDPYKICDEWAEGEPKQVHDDVDGGL